jgi:ribosomal protein S18 acetylase RimI-like enzyme
MADEFIAKDGRTVVIRKLRVEDLNGLLELVNSTVREGAPINRMTELSRTEEAEFLPRRLAEIERGDTIQIIAEVEGELIGNAEIRRHVGRQSHVGTMGMSVKSGFRKIGIGARLMEKIIGEGNKQELKIVTLQVNETNFPAITLYKKLGFKETGRIPKAVYWNEKYVDDIIMVKDLCS